jgi:hypothetical protein
MNSESFEVMQILTAIQLLLIAPKQKRGKVHETDGTILYDCSGGWARLNS